MKELDEKIIELKNKWEETNLKKEKILNKIEELKVQKKFYLEEEFLFRMYVDELQEIERKITILCEALRIILN